VIARGRHVRGAARRRPSGHAERGAALLVAILLAAAVAAVVGGVTAFAILDARVSAADRETARTSAAVEAALELALAALAAEPDLDAVRLGTAAAPANGEDAIATPGGVVDVAALTREMERARGRQPPPWNAGVWRAYAWGRLGDRLAAPGGRLTDDPLVVVWVRAGPADAGAGRLDLAVTAVGSQGARAMETARAEHGPAGVTLLAVWPEADATGS
jgi:Tfp pilus assembly protein PilX